MKIKFIFLIVILFFAETVIAQIRPSGVNLVSNNYYGTQLAFKDAFKQTSPWLTKHAGSVTPWNTDSTFLADANGYPLQVPFGGSSPQHVHTLFLRQLDDYGSYPAGIYTLLAEGTGTIQLEWDGGNQTYNFTGALTTTLTVNPTNAGIHLIITASDVNDHVKNIRFVMPGFINDYETDPYYPPFLNFLDSANLFAAIRFMPFMETSNSPIVSWDQRTLPTSYTQGTLEGRGGGVAYEYMIDISNRLNKDMWISIPHQANDDFIQNFAALLHDSLESNLKIYVEYTNEAWNGIFDQNQYCADQGAALGYIGQPWDQGWQFYAKRSADIHHIFEQEFGVNSPRLIKVVAGQAGSTSGWLANRHLTYYNDPFYNPNGVTADAYAIAPYFGGGLADSIGDAGAINSITVPQILSSLHARALNTYTTIHNHDSVVRGIYGLDLIAYEGGQHLVAVNQTYLNNQTLTDKLIAANRDPMMENIYCDYFDVWYNNGGGVFFQFSSIYKPNKYGSWGIVENLMEPLTDWPKYRAMLNCTSNGISVSGSTSICQGGSTTLTASGADTYSWSPNTDLSSTTGAIVTATPASTRTYTVTGTTGVYISTAIITIDVSALSLTLSPASTTVCSGTTTVLTAGGADAYSWLPASNLSTTTGAIVSATPGYNTTYTVTGTSGSCVGTSTAAITVNSLPTLTTSSSSSICSGDLALLTASGATLYNWSPAANLNTNTGTSVMASPTTTITYTVTGTTLSGCSDAEAIQITVHPKDDPYFAYSSGTFCETLAVNPLPTITGGYTGTFTSSNPASLIITNASTGEVDILSSTIGTYTITLTTTGTNCPNSYAIPFTISASPFDASFSYSGPYCQQGANPSPTFTTGSAGIFTSAPAGLTFTNPTTGEINLSQSSPGTYTVTNTIPASGTCAEVSFDNIVEIHQGATIDGGIDTSICEGNSYTLSGSIGGSATSGSWNTAGDGTFINGNTVNATYTPGTNDVVNGSVVLTITSDDPSGTCGSVSDNMTITINKAPVLTTTASHSICTGTQTILTTAGAETYNWQPAEGLNTITGANVTATITSSSTYTVTGTDSLSCTNKATVSIILHALPVVSTTGNTTICDGESSTLIATGATSYEWQPPVYLDITSGTTVSSSPPVGTMTYSVIGTDAHTCKDTSTVSVTVNPFPVITASSDVAICKGNTANLSANGASSYTWSPVTVPPTGITVSAAPEETTTYTITGSIGSCSDTTSLIITVHSIPTVEAGNDTTIYIGQSITLSATGGGPGYDWRTTEGTICTNCQQITVSPETTTKYYVTTADSNNCTTSDSLEVQCKQGEIFVPNVFSPNADGQNDILLVYGLGTSAEMTFQIYDRWGKKLFESKAIHQGWDGNYKGSALSPAVFMYSLNVTLPGGETISKSGNITLVR